MTPNSHPSRSGVLSITSDGTPMGTEVRADGMLIDGVLGITFTLRHDEIATVLLEVDAPELQLQLAPDLLNAVTVPRTDPPRPGQVLKVPLDNNGYAAVSRRPLHLPAIDVQVGDIVVDGGYLSQVTEVRDLGPLPGHGGHAVFLAGATNRIRFPHEVVTVIRPGDQP